MAENHDSAPETARTSDLRFRKAQANRSDAEESRAVETAGGPTDLDSMAAIIRWQERMAKRPVIWVVIVDNEHTGNFYESKESAAHEAAYYARRGGRAKVHALGRLHDDALSRERWGAR